MNKISSAKRITIGAVCIALCYTLPAAFHAAQLGSVLSPMHIPVLLCGLICGGGYGLICGIVGPMLSSLLTGMPTPTGLIFMVPELAVYGLVSGLCMQLIHTRKPYLDTYIALIAAMFLGRVAGGVANALFYLEQGDSFTIVLWVSSYFINSMPGIITHLVLLPLLMMILTGAKVIPARYPKPTDRRSNMRKQDIISFFDKCAPWWDADMIRNEDIIATILDNGGIKAGQHILDVACGTGVLFPDYLKRGAASVTGIDISPEMAKLARQKYPEVNVICGDVETTKFDQKFDAIMVYNAFPHFPDPARLIEVLAELIHPGGKLSVAHGMSRDALIQHHQRASTVSIDLLEAQELAALFAPWFEVDVIISDDRMYQVSGIRK